MLLEVKSLEIYPNFSVTNIPSVHMSRLTGSDRSPFRCINNPPVRTDVPHTLPPLHRRRKHLKSGRAKLDLSLPSPPFPLICFPSLPHSPQPLPFFLYPPFLRRRPLNAAMISWEHYKLPQWGLGRSPSRQTIWFIFEPKEHLSLRQFFCGFFFKNITFCTKNNHDTIYTAQLYSMLTGAREVL